MNGHYRLFWAARKSKTARCCHASNQDTLPSSWPDGEGLRASAAGGTDRLNRSCAGQGGSPVPSMPDSLHAARARTPTSADAAERMEIARLPRSVLIGTRGALHGYRRVLFGLDHGLRWTAARSTVPDQLAMHTAAVALYQRSGARK